MSALSVVRDAALRFGVQPPGDLFGNVTRTSLELQSLLNECAQAVAFDAGHDWTALKALATISGDGVAQAFPLPADYRRMLKTTRLYRSKQPGLPLTHITDSDEWLARGGGHAPGAWTLIGGQIWIKVSGRALPAGETVQFYYLSNAPVMSGGNASPAFNADADTFRLDERLLKLALIYRWKQAHGQDYAEELSDYGNALAEQVGNDRGSNIFAVGRRSSVGAHPSYPGTLGV